MDMTYDIEASNATTEEIGGNAEQKTLTFRADMEEDTKFYYNISLGMTKSGEVLIARESFATIANGQLDASHSEQKGRCVLKPLAN